MLARPRYGRRRRTSDGVETSAGVAGHRHGSRTRTLTGTFGRTEIAVPRARLMQPDGGTTEWKSQALRAYQRRTRAAEALIASAYLAGVNTRRVRRALAALFGGAVGKDIVSRTWRKVKGDWDAWNARSLADEPIVRLILDGTVVRVRLDRKATAISLLVVIGVRADGQKVLLAVRSMGGESAEAWRAVLDDLIKRGLRRPDFLIVDGAAGLDAAIAAVWDGVPVQRCTVHKHRNLLAHAPERLHDEITADYYRHDLRGDARGDRDAPQGVHPQMAAQASRRRRQPGGGGRAVVRIHRDCRRASGRARGQRTRSNGCTKSSSDGSRRRPCCPPPKPPPCCSGRLLASGQINMRKVDGWQTLATRPSLSPLTSPPETIPSCLPETAPLQFPTTFATAPRRSVRPGQSVTAGIDSPCARRRLHHVWVGANEIQSRSRRSWDAGSGQSPANRRSTSKAPYKDKPFGWSRKARPSLTHHSTHRRSRTAVGAEEWLRRGQTKEWAQKQVSCQDIVITIREDRHQFCWHKKQEQSRISPSDTVVMLTGSGTRSLRRGPRLSCRARGRRDLLLFQVRAHHLPQAPAEISKHLHAGGRGATVRASARRRSIRGCGVEGDGVADP